MKNSFIIKFCLAIKQAFNDNRLGYSFWILLISLNGILCYYEYIYLESSMNIAYIFTNSISDSITSNFDYFWITIKPIIILMIIFFINNRIMIISNYIRLYLSKVLNTSHDFRLTNRLANIHWENYEKCDVSNKISLIKNEGTNAYESLNNNFVFWIITILTNLSIYLIYIARIEWWIPLFFLIMAIVYIFIGIICGNKVYKNYVDTEIIRKKRTYLYNATKAKDSHQDAIVNRLYNYITPKWKDLNDQWSNKNIASNMRKNYYSLIPDLVYAIIMCSVLYMSVVEIKTGTKEIGYVVTLIGITVALGVKLKDFSFSFGGYVKDAKIYGDYLNILNIENENSDLENYLSDKYVVEFKNVTYLYPQSSHKALDGLNFKFKNNEIISLIGHNGSGKTTFVNLLIELTKKYEGDITVNGNSINKKLGILRKNCICIFQDFTNYQLTIKENIILGNGMEDVEDDEIWDVLNKVGIKEYVEKLPNNINTMLGQIEKGIDLSKGQWQRLAIARMMINKKAKIWILDEPTAHLDPIAEIELYNLVREFKNDKTIFFISHRLGFSKNASRIVVFKGGKIVEDSTHNELIKDVNSEYYKMYEKQKKWYE